MTEESENNGFCNDSWDELRTILINNKIVTAELEELKTEFDENSPIMANVETSNLAAKMEDKNLKINFLKRKIELMQKLFMSKRRTVHEVDDRIEKKTKDFSKLKNKNTALEIKIQKNNERKMELKKFIYIFTRLTAHRKVILIQEVADVFKIEIDGGPASQHQPDRDKRECRCVLIDTIRGLHLPHTNVFHVPGHNEIETTSALGYMIHALDTISMILDYFLRYPIYYASSLSEIENPLEDKSVILFGWRKRLDREKLSEGLIWLGKNIAQLRADCGIPTPVADKMLSVLIDWVRSISGGKYVCIYERPIESIFSPACLFINYE